MYWMGTEFFDRNRNYVGEPEGLEDDARQLGGLLASCVPRRGAFIGANHSIFGVPPAYNAAIGKFKELFIDFSIAAADYSRYVGICTKVADEVSKFSILAKDYWHSSMTKANCDTHCESATEMTEVLIATRPIGHGTDVPLGGCRSTSSRS